MTDNFHTLLAERDVLIADGATGTSLFKRGLETGDAPELWNIEHPDRVKHVNEEFVAAGSDLVLTNSFGGNAYRLKLHNAQDRVRELNAAAGRLAREVADIAGHTVLVAGSMGPTGEIFQPVGSLSHEDGVAAFKEQALALKEGGVDCLWIETISGVEELTAAIEGAAAAELPIVCTMTFDTNGRTMMGIRPQNFIAMHAELPTPPAAMGANCGIGPAQLLDSVLGFAEVAPDNLILVAKGNCGIPEYRDGHIHYSGTPEIMADYAVLARDAGARIIGGCCGTTGEHVAAMVKALKDTPRGPRPSRELVEAKLGPIAVSATGEAANTDAAPRRERRRRRA